MSVICLDELQKTKSTRDQYQQRNLRLLQQLQQTEQARQDIVQQSRQHSHEYRQQLQQYQQQLQDSQGQMQESQETVGTLRQQLQDSQGQLHFDSVYEKDSYIAQLTRKLHTVIKEKDKKEEIITTLQTQLQEYKQQNLPRTPQRTTGLLLL